MIFYFSATGNSKYIAKKIAAVTNDKIVSVAECVNNGSLHHIISDARIVFITPTYAWGLPSIVCSFLQNVEITCREDAYICFAATYGTSSGGTGQMAQHILKRKGIQIDAFFDVKMPDTWTITYDLSDKEKVKRINLEADTAVRNIASQILQCESGDFRKAKLPLLPSYGFYYLFYNRMRMTSHFRVEKQCIGCGRCASLCPIHAIEIHDKKPLWTTKQCVMCLSCLHHCPVFAIQYGKRTKRHGQYVHEEY